MKNKPKRHKSENTFKFQTFSERISNIDIDVFHKVKHPYEEDDDNENTFYIQTLHKLNNDNFAPNYIELSKKLPNDVYSLAQLLAQKDSIMDVLVKYIRSCDPEFLPPALELIVAVAKDLRKDFYPYFYPTILRECIQLLDTRDPDQIECIFVCLAHLFKLLWSSIIRNINAVLPELLPLLSDMKPRYINDFAAESFAFVARKVRDKSQFLILSLKNIVNNEDELVGVAKLFFEVISSVGHQFHSAAEEFLTVLLRELDCHKWSELLFNICDNIVTNIISFVNGKTNVTSIWKSFMKVLTEFYTKWSKSYDEHDAVSLTMVLQLVKRIVSSREDILRDPTELASFMVTLGTNNGIKTFEPLHIVAVEIVSCLITNEHYSGKIRHGDEIIIQMMTNIDKDKLMTQFIEKIISSNLYEITTMSKFLQYVYKKELNQFLTGFLVKIVWLKTRFCIEYEDKLLFYSSCLKSAPNKFLVFLLDVVQSANKEVETSSVENILHSIVILSFMNCEEVFANAVDNFITRLCDKLHSDLNEADVAKFLYVLLVTVQYRRKCNRPVTFDYNILILTAIKFVASTNYICSLRLLDEISSINDISCLRSDENERKLIDNLNSPFHKVRLYTLQLLTKLNVDPIFEALLRIESIPPSIEMYREKLQLLQKLECNEQFLDENRGNELSKVATLKFLFGNLYINFQYLWEPVRKLIVSHLENETSAWLIVEYLLKEAIENDMNSTHLMENLAVNFDADFLSEYFYDLNGVDDRPDFYNFRCLLYETLISIQNLQFTNKNLIPELFLKFYSNEYKTNAFEYQVYTNLMTMDKELAESQENANTSIIKINDETKKPDKNLNRLLIIYLKLLNNIASQIPQKLKTTISDKYFELLSNGNSEIQQLAVTYIVKVLKLTAHKERLQLLTKENSLKDQLLNIKLDFEAGLFPDKDRANFMKVVLKLLYGKGKKKCSTQLRDTIFEFLAGCENTEIISYFDLCFNCEIFRNTVKSTITPTSFLREEVNFENTISPSCLMSFANTVLELFKRAGKLLKPSCLSYLLRVTFRIAAYLVVYLGKRTEVHSGYHNLLAKVRITTFEIMIQFVDNFDYNWKKDELKAMLQLFVEPWIEKIPNECLQSPNPALKLLIAFTHNPRYFPLLAVNFGELTPMDTIIQLLNSSKVYSNVKNAILKIIERLLLLEETHFANFTSDLTYLSEIPIIENQKYGKTLLQSHIDVILQHLRNQLAKKYVKMDGIYMHILKSISEFALDEASSVRLLTLLMPVLRSKASADDDIVGPLLETIMNLFKTFVNYDNFESYLLQIASLFNENLSTSTRRKLCELLMYFSEKTGTKFVDAELIQGLNMMQKRWLDQPDYAERLETFKKINKLCEHDELNFYTGVFTIYNCFHMIKTEKDMALRDHSGLCLKRICPKLCHKYANQMKQSGNILLNVVLLPLIKEGVQSNNNENYNYESILLLGHLVRECESVHFVFRNLYPLSDKTDLENDFFENILHLQHYRRIKALKKFTEIMSKSTKQPQPYSLSFILPLISECLLSPKYSGEHGLINCAIEALKTICLLNSWRYYEKTLREFLLEMRKNTSLRKQGIRIMSTILDAFHFDISQANTTESWKKKRENEKMEIDEDVDIGEEADGVKTNDEMLPIVKRITVLCPSDATRLYRSIKSFLVPSLDRAFMTYEDSEQHRKLNKKVAGSGSDKEEMAVMSIPIAFAIVKLLKRLPQPLLDEYVTTIFLKLSTYLKSRLPSIRRVARETMQNILLEIGCKYFPKLLSEMMSILTKGFQLHVLVFTSHAVLEKIESGLQKGDADDFIDPILEICIVDLFGKVAEEKEVEKISSKVPEAKGNISYNMLRILSEHVSECRILDMVLPLKEIISIRMSSKTVNKVKRCFHYIATGLSHNKHITSESLLEFSYGVSNDCIPQLVAERENEHVRVELQAPVQKADSFLIPEEPRRMTAEKRKICVRTNAHVIIGFGMELLALLLKRDAIKSSAYLPYLDPFVPLINDCLRSQHTELIILSLKCLTKLLLRDLPSLRKSVPNISDAVFELLGKYSTGGGTNDNIELLMATTKVAQTLIHPKMKHEINNAQVRILLFVVEDLQNNRSHYATGFSLLNSICERGFNLPELHELMKTTAELSIKSYYDEIRLYARKAFYQYFMRYPLGKKLREYVLFYSSQLKYEELTGRISALEMLRVLIRKFSMVNETDNNNYLRNSKEREDIKKILLELSSVLYVQLAFRLIQDNSPECKKMASECISDIISFIQGTKGEEELFSVTIIWLKEKKVCHRRLAVQLLAIFAHTQKEKFSSKLETVLPLMADQLYDQGGNDEPGKFVRVAVRAESESMKMEKDRLVFQVLQFYKTLLEAYPAFLTNESYADNIRQIGESCQSMLRHPHEWVRIEAVQILVIIFKSMNPSEVASIINKKLPYQEAFLKNEQCREQIKTLCLDLCDQLAPGVEVMEALLKGTAINLRFLAEVLQNVKRSEDKLSLRWLANKVAKQIRIEVMRTPQNYSVRTIGYTWFAALAVKLQEEKVTKLLPVVLQSVLRELSTNDQQGVEIRRKAKEVLGYYRQKTNADDYDKLVTKVQRSLDVKRAKRKMQNARMVITDPERAARRKMKMRLKRKSQRVKRLEKLRKRKFKSGRKKRVEIQNE